VDKYFIPICESTNLIARFFLEGGKPIPFVVTAEVQTRGRGQKGRLWVSEKGGLYSSFVVRRMDSRKALIIGALSSYYVLTRYVPVKVRFPNDLMVGKKKIGGVLVENTSSASIIGIGINVNQKKFPNFLENEATSLFLENQREYDLDEVLDSLIRALEENLDLPYNSLYLAYKKVVSFPGPCILHLSGGRNFLLVIEDVDRNFNLITGRGIYPFEEIVWIEWLW